MILIRKQKDLKYGKLFYKKFGSIQDENKIEFFGFWWEQMLRALCCHPMPHKSVRILRESSEPQNGSPGLHRIRVL